MISIRITSLNVKGLNHPIKRKKVLTWIKKQDTRIALLQETHIHHLEYMKLKKMVGSVKWLTPLFPPKANRL